MTVQLGIRHASTRAAVDGWFVPGDQAHACLPEVLGFGFQWRDVGLLPIASAGRADCIGLLVVPPAGAQPHRVVRARPYQLRGDKVWLPVDAELWPPIADEDLRALSAGRTLVCHPAAGVVAFEPDDILGLHDLLQGPGLAGAKWDRARPGTAVVGGIVEVVADTPPDLAELFAEDRNEVAKDDPSKLPKLPGERQRLRRFVPGIGGLMARLVFSMTRNVSRTADAPTWIDRLEAWAGRFERGGSFADRSQRERELQRLLSLLQDDPSKGLRFALPIGGDADGRGTASPSNRLGEHNVDFSLSGFGGGQAVDGWDVPASMHWQLSQTYRELANAEIAAGRHRRAAYIFGHLLSDLRAAAQALQKGGFHREAAVLFKDKLNDSASAARCLLKGGYLLEAAELEESVGNLERAGDLRLILRQDAQARVLYEREWHARIDAEQWVAAATLRAERLRDVGGALASLHEKAAQGHFRCFAAWLALAERDGRRTEVLHAIRTQRVSGIGVAGLAKVLGAYAARVGPGEVRDATRGRVRELASEHMPMAPEGERRILMAALRQCSPDDRVLPHDLRVAARARGRLQVPARSRSGEVRLLRGGMSLTVRSMAWLSAASNDRGLWLAGWDADSGARRVYRLPWGGGGDVEQISLASLSGAALQLHPLRTRRLMGLRSSESNGQWRFETMSNSVGSTASIAPSDGIAMATDDDGSIWELHEAADGLALQRNSADLDLLGTARLPELDVEAYELEEVSMVAVHGRVVISCRTQVLIANADGLVCQGELPQVARRIVRSEEGSNPIVLIALQEGFCAVDIRADDLPAFHVHGMGLHEPTVGWTRHGVAIAVDRDAIWLGRKQGNVLPTTKLIDYGHGQPWAIVPTPQPDEVAFVLQQAITLIRLI